MSAPAAELDAAMDASDNAGEAPAEGEAAAEPAAAEPAAAEGGDAPAEASAGEAKPDPVAEAMAASLGVPADRAARLIEVLDIIGNRIEEVRLVRVFQGEQGPHGSIARGEFHYAIDRVASGKPRRRDDRDDRRGGG
ncbi:MAG TPA: hypothetical protein VFP84_31360, partial [Kofleriaceae bacterium]|nr:hypothetical protein [Kofleriaceae bacterium]